MGGGCGRWRGVGRWRCPQLLACSLPSVLSRSASGGWRIDGVNEPSELPTQHLTPRKSVFEVGQDQSSTRERLELVLNFVSRPARLTQVFRELWITVETTTLGNVFVN